MTHDIAAQLEAQAQSQTTAEALVTQSLQRIDAVDHDVQAWQYLEPELALKAARQCDVQRQAGAPLAPLHGIPVGLKDIIDTADMPTENGTPIDAGRQPNRDAVLVERLRAAGAVIVGKTVTTELAYLQPSRTRNPEAEGRTPGGSSSGSAAAVAANMVPVAIGTQTGGSVIRPASFCGVVGYKPTFGAIPRTGVLQQSPSLDTVGVFARSVEDAARVAEPLFGPDAADPSSLKSPPQGLVESLAGSQGTPRLAFVRTPYWDQADEHYRRALYAWVAELGEAVREDLMPSAWDDVAALRALINNVEMAHWFEPYRASAADRLSEEVSHAMRAGTEVTAVAYIDAIERQALLRESSDALFRDIDAIICPAAPGAAPEGYASTGNPIFNGLWTFLGVPAITLPLLSSEEGAPIGVQLVARSGNDVGLLRAAHWLEINSARRACLGS